MEPKHRRIAEIALSVGGVYGFALAGGYAVRVHGMGDRPSADVDLFTDWHRRADFPAAVDEIIKTFVAQGFLVEAPMRNETFARLLLTHPDSGDPDKLELSADWRAHPPVLIDLGPVLHPDDAVANKMTALFGRAEARDFLDVDAAVSSGRYSRERLLELASQADSGFDPTMFADALGSLEQLIDTEFDEYGINTPELMAMRGRFSAWRVELLRES